MFKTSSAGNEIRHNQSKYETLLDFWATGAAPQKKAEF
jgi:hypothetical protein